MKLVPHGEPYAGKLHVRFDEGAGVPHGASRSTLHPFAFGNGCRHARLAEGVISERPCSFAAVFDIIRANGRDRKGMMRS